MTSARAARPRRPTGLLRPFAAVLLALLATTARPQDDEPEAEPPPTTCRCALREACYHFLRAPVSAPDPCPCPKCVPGAEHPGDKAPEGWSQDCFLRKDLGCFLKRQAASWKLTCSVCTETKDCCKSANPARCPACQAGDAPSPWRKDAEKTLEERMAVERKLFDRGKPVIVIGRRFYVVTDVPSVRVMTPHAGARLLSGHEYAHVLVIRAEQALREFTAAFGSPRISRPIGIFLTERERDMEEVRETYFRNRNAPMIYSAYAGSSESAISEGFCLNGLCISVGRVGGSDTGIHQAVRHFLGNIFVTNWIVTSGELRTTPPWMFEGLGHWLGKRPENLKDEVYYLEGEVGPISGSGKAWDLDIARIAKRDGFRPIEEILAATSLGKLTYRDFQQCWGYFHVAMEDVPKKWAGLVSDLRRKTDVHQAFTKNLGWSADEFHRRFVDRLAGRRRTLEAGLQEGGPADATTIASERDPVKAAARIRAVGVPKDAATVQEILEACSREGDLVRETALLALRKTKDEAALLGGVTAALASGNPKVRASSARLVRTMRIAGARDAVRKLLGDPTWFVRAEAMLAAAAIRDFDAQRAMRESLGDGNPKLRIAACDALRTLGKDAHPHCVPLLVKCLDHADWQVRVAACEALGVVGDVEAVSALVTRMPNETARVFDAIRSALKALTGDDLGAKPEHWRSWWEREEARARERKGFPPPSKPAEADSRYAAEGRPTYHGVILWTARIGFVLDTSRSTNRLFTLPQDVADRILGGRTKSTVQEASAAEIGWTLRQLDDRTRFTMWAFGDDVLRWGSGLVPATASNADSAAGWAKAHTPAGETNFHGALKAALGIDEADPWSAALPSGPDTITFLTDGTPTSGEITDADVLAAWFAEVNRYPRVRTHTIAFGSLGVDEPLLQRMAASSGGEFRQVREMH